MLNDSAVDDLFGFAELELDSFIWLCGLEVELEFVEFLHLG